MRALVYTMIIAMAITAGACSAPKSQIPQNLVGCWLNDTTLDWELGLFEDFAIYRNDCWNYASVGGDATNADIVLTLGDKNVKLSINSLTDSTLAIAVNNAAPHHYMRHTNFFMHYTHPDTASLEKASLDTDSATVILYTRNTLKGIVPLLFRFQQINSSSIMCNDPFGCTLWAQGTRYCKTQFGKCDKVRLPVNGLCQISGLLGTDSNIKILLPPGDTLVFVVNVDDKFSHLCMGKYGRLNNELSSVWSCLRNDFDTIEPRRFFEQKMYENSQVFANGEYSSRCKSFIANDLKYKKADQWLSSIVGDSLAAANELPAELLSLMPTIDDIASNCNAARFASHIYEALGLVADDSRTSILQNMGVSTSVIEFCLVTDCISKISKAKSDNRDKPLDTKPLEQIRPNLSPEFYDIARQAAERIENEIYFSGSNYRGPVSYLHVDYQEDSNNTTIQQ